MIRILHTHQYDNTLCRRYITSGIQVTRVKYNQYTLFRLKVLVIWLKICRFMIKRVLIFLEGIVCKHLLVWTFLLIYFNFLRNIYWKCRRTWPLQVQIKIAIEITLRNADDGRLSPCYFARWARNVLLHTRIDILNLVSLKNVTWHLTFRSINRSTLGRMVISTAREKNSIEIPLWASRVSKSGYFTWYTTTWQRMKNLFPRQRRK